MRILIASEHFPPSFGGVETVTRLLSQTLTQMGHEATVVTNEKSEESDEPGCEVVRRPGTVRLLQAYRRADAVILQGPVMRLGWPLLGHRRCAVMVHHMRLGEPATAVTAFFRAAVTRRVRHAAVSHALARTLPYPAVAILPNPYDDAIFKPDPQVRRTCQILFVGRLIPEKGALLLCEALKRLRPGLTPLTVTVVGAGPERARLENFFAARHGSYALRLAGQVGGRALAQLFQEHRILVVPSVQHEGFGLVAVEGIACGCAVVASDVGGLPEAIGPCGMSFPAGDADSLAQMLHQLLDSNEKISQLLSGAEQHLAKHRRVAVALRYLELIQHCPVSEALISGKWARHNKRFGAAT